MIKLHQFNPAFGLPNGSPFCMKLETWLRMAGLPYETVNDGNLPQSPKGKLPWIEDGSDRVGDTTLAIEHLTRKYGVTLDAGLTARQLALGTALQRLMEENLYWALVYTRWFDAAGWRITRKAFFGHLPAALQKVVPTKSRRALKAKFIGQGMGRHTPNEIIAIGCRDLTAIADLLGDQPYLLGDQASTIDATGYAFLANVLWAPLDTPLQRHARLRPDLQAYCERMKARYFP